MAMRCREACPLWYRVRLYYRSGTDGPWRCCICARQTLRFLSLGGTTTLSCVKWRHACHFQIRQITNSVLSVNAYLRKEHSCQTTSLSDLKQRSVGFLKRSPQKQQQQHDVKIWLGGPMGWKCQLTIHWILFGPNNFDTIATIWKLT